MQPLNGAKALWRSRPTVIIPLMLVVCALVTSRNVMFQRRVASVMSSEAESSIGTHQQQHQQQQQQQQLQEEHRKRLLYRPDAVQFPESVLATDAVGSSTRVGEGADGRFDNTVQLQATDYVYSKGMDAAPVVIEDCKILFFTMPQVTSLSFKKILMRMSKCKDWEKVTRRDDGNRAISPEMLARINNPNLNCLKYLYDYPLDQAQEMMTSPNWTRAIFVRDPKEILMWAYRQKATGSNSHVYKQCCQTQSKDKTTAENTAAAATTATTTTTMTSLTKEECDNQLQSFEGFVNITKSCQDPNWSIQSQRIDNKFWKSINFIGYYDTIAWDTRRLIRGKCRTSGWNQFGKSGWAGDGGTVFADFNKRYPNPDKAEYFNNSKQLEREVEELYKDDYQYFTFDREARGKKTLD